MKTKFFIESYSLGGSYKSKEENYHYIPKENYSVRKSVGYVPHTNSIELDESELVLKKTESSKTLFSTPRDQLPDFFIDSRVQVKMTDAMGMGCFAIDDIPVNTIIESCPVILVHSDTFINLNQYNGGRHKLSEYPFGWGRDGLCAFALGYGGLYNHKAFPNVAWRPNHKIQSIQYVTKEDVKKGSELFIRYLPLDNLEMLWFSDDDSEEYVRQRGEKPKEMMGVISTWKTR
jgi:hypothetical protein